MDLSRSCINLYTVLDLFRRSQIIERWKKTEHSQQPRLLLSATTRGSGRRSKPRSATVAGASCGRGRSPPAEGDAAADAATAGEELGSSAAGMEPHARVDSPHGMG